MFGMHIVNGCLLAPLYAHPEEDGLRRLQEAILQQVQADSPRGVILDVSAVTYLDRKAFARLADTARMVALMGARPVFVGFQAGVAAALIDLQVECGSLETAVNLEDAFLLLQAKGPAPADEPGPGGQEPPPGGGA